jgi:hypothetical protein
MNVLGWKFGIMLIQRTFNYDGMTHYLTFDDEKHIYILDGELVPGATDVKKGYPTSFVLEQWGRGKAAEYVLDALTEECDGKRYPKTDVNWPLKKTHIKELIKEAKNATQRVLEETADVGTIMHDYCYAIRLRKHYDDTRLLGHKDEATIRQRFLEVDKWCAERDKEETVVAAEEIVGSCLYKFAGKFDVVVRRHDTGNFRLQDYKSSKGFYVDQFIQAGGYRQAIKETLRLDIRELEIIRFNDNTEEPDPMLMTEGIEDFTREFILCRNTRSFQRKWEPVFDKLYRTSRNNSKKKDKVNGH